MPQNRKNKNSISHVTKAMARIFALAICAALIFTLFIPFVAEAETKSEKKVRVGWYESAYCRTGEDGRRSGLAYEYQQRVAAYAGWDYEYVEGSWDELYKMLVDGDIDILSDVSYREDRADYVSFATMPMGSETYYLYIHAGNTKLDPGDIRTFRDAKIGVTPDSVSQDLLKDWAETNNLNIELPDMSGYSVKECFDKVKSGELDAYIYYDAVSSDDDVMPVFNIGEADYYFAVTKSRPDLLYELNQALLRLRNEDPYYNQRLYDKYVYPVSTSTFISEDELKWMSDHGPIKIGYRNNYLPFCEEREGAVYGALSDYLNYAGTCLKNGTIEFDAIAYNSTEESLEALNKGEIDAVFPLFLSPYDCEEMNLLVTNPIMRTEVYAVVGNKNRDIINGSGTKVSLLTGNINFDNFVRDNFPNWTIQNYYPTLEECYESVAEGKADCAMVLSYRINKTEMLRRRYNLALMATGQDMVFSIAVRDKDIELFSILNKTANTGTENKVDSYFYKYYSADDKITFKDYLKDNLRTAAMVLALIVIVILVLILLKMRSDKQASERQALIAETEHDPLTGLYTRNYFFAYAERMFRENPDYKMDAIVVNVEQFHTVNALYGWDFGDMVLITLGKEISSYLEETDGIACRSTADRFDIYCLHMDDYQVLFDRLQQKLNGITENVVILLRMGVMPWQRDLGPVQLFDRARTACSMIKGGHHSRLMVFSEEMRQKELRDQKLLNDIRKGIETKEFLVYYQPKYDIKGETPVLKSAEALIRWKHSELGMISPGVFISLFEKNNLIGHLDKYVWTEVAAQSAKWKKKYGYTLPVSVNISRKDVFDQNLENWLDQMMDDNGLSRDMIHLEVTESAYTSDGEQVINVVGNLRKKGYVVEMDDFGTGYSSLNMLTSMPVDILKLDMGFVKNIGKDEKDSRMVELILDIAQNLKLAVVAEGVETQEQYEFLKERGCDYIQGYYFSKPLPADEFEKLAFEEK